MRKQGILIVGSANMDLVATLDRYPRPGETLFGKSFGMFPGGKGANQAVCCARLGGRVRFIGKMGRDVFRNAVVRQMRWAGVDMRHLLIDDSVSTGIALITLDRTGQNEIVVVSGSNMRLTPADVRRARTAFSAACIVVCQLEIPLPTVAETIRLAKAHGAVTLLNPAPARALPAALLRNVDYLTPNETEAEILTGVRVTDERSAEGAARILRRDGVGTVIVTLGRRGCLMVGPDGMEQVPAFRVRSVDTTAAGDAFSGGFAFALAQGKAVREAIEFASAVAACSVMRLGAQTSMPSLRDVRHFLARHSK